jgi:hypothetical protein
MKTLVVKSIVILKNFGTQLTIDTTLDLTVVAELCALLSILREDIVDVIEIQFKNFKIILKKTSKDFSKCNLCDFKGGIFKGEISMSMLEYLLFFLLKYYKDGIAEAQHIDLDFAYEQTEVTLTINAKNYILHSPEQIKKLLGD